MRVSDYDSEILSQVKFLTDFHTWSIDILYIMNRFLDLIF